MIYNPYSDGALTRALKRYREAVEDKAFQGTIPAGESDEAAEAYAAIDVELERAQELLIDLIGRRVNTPRGGPTRP